MLAKPVLIACGKFDALAKKELFCVQIRNAFGKLQPVAARKPAQIEQLDTGKTAET